LTRLCSLYDKLLRSATIQPFQRDGTQYFRATNQYGAIAFEPRGPSMLKSATQLFQNGEIWGFNNYLLLPRGNGRNILLPSQAIEATFRKHLPTYVSFAVRELEIPLPYTVELGLTGIRDAYIAMPENEQWGAIHAPNLSFRAVINRPDESALREALISFFSKIYDLAGYARPTGLYGFPP
jgi:hypothetical protein